MRSILQRFLGFDRLMGPALVRLVYYFGAAVIVVMTGVNVLLAFMQIVSGNFGSGVMQLIATPAVAAVVFIYWRFLCELFMLAFLAYERLGEVRDLMRIAAGQPAAPDSDHPAF
ncbi:MAG TPA: DUF4282 domain-containing protein [Vitreimonas sp.]|jgi:hypothetical protein|nr:DUF4282 domain-containing protein [Vitreimonas sp.]